jgi:hypothetical protein
MKEMKKQESSKMNQMLIISLATICQTTIVSIKRSFKLSIYKEENQRNWRYKYPMKLFLSNELQAGLTANRSSSLKK